jgi:hypothetical protein
VSRLQKKISVEKVWTASKHSHNKLLMIITLKEMSFKQIQNVIIQDELSFPFLHVLTLQTDLHPLKSGSKKFSKINIDHFTMCVENIFEMTRVDAFLQLVSSSLYLTLPPSEESQ